MPVSDYHGLDGWALAEGLRERHFSCHEVTSTAISLAEQLNPKLNAIVCTDFQNALDLATRFDNSPNLYQLSPIAGLPFLLKDLADMAGLPTRCGSAITP
ncbi:MAG: amidase family protein, partial [Gammaproteobacteria bacterium]